jgi:hypothetical protein
MIAGTLLWWYAAPQYDVYVGKTAARVIRVDSRFPDMRAVQKDRGLQIDSEGGQFPPMVLPADQITYNIILFLALLATVRGLFRDRTVARLPISFLIMFAVHVLVFVIAIESFYATSPDNWSVVHFRDAERDIWLLTSLFIRTVGLLAASFLCWLFVRPSDKTPSETPVTKKPRRKKS